MLKNLLILGAVLCTVSSSRYQGVRKRNQLKKLLRSLDKGVYATCEMIFFKQPLQYKSALKSCESLRIGRAHGETLATVDSKERNGHLMFLYDLAFQRGSKESSEETKWVWSGLHKVQNKHVKYNSRKMKKKRNVVNAYDPNDWKWIGTGNSPTGYHNWPRTRKGSRPDQQRMKYSRITECKERKGCFQNQVKINQETSSWEDSFAFEVHPYACDYKGKYILSNERKTWLQAKKACAAAGLTLAMVRSEEEVAEMTHAIKLFFGDEEYDTWSNNNWIWLGGNDLEEEGKWVWLNGDLVETWDIPWKAEAGNDNADFIDENSGQDALAFSRDGEFSKNCEIIKDGEFDDSFHSSRYKKRAFACQCPGS